MKGEYVDFEEQPMRASRKTKMWLVCSKTSGGALGTVKWYSQWRRYCFFPEACSLFDTKCLREITSFIAQRMEERLTARRKSP